ncbi:uncharacterized protein LOC105636967 [Jatropha curcas]|uniref:uncharacterized protein LOC105636967 n=1 Tax=Jatropha curcas TaxID=180498 RepID=UPI0005FC36EE|nr:uncharacterized protein LOC105636967 [Jatropha curcas]
MSAFRFSLWKLHIPLKIKSFIWSLGSDCVPVKSLLLKGRVEVDSSRPVCTVPSALDVFDLNPHPDIKEWLVNMCAVLEVEDFKVVCMVLWAIWQNRNNLLWRNQRQSVHQSVSAAIAFLQSWQNARVLATCPSTMNLPAVTVWSKPPAGSLKCKTDAAIPRQDGKIGAGWVLRDELGAVVNACQKVLLGSQEPFMAEALSFREALSWVMNKGSVSFVRRYANRFAHLFATPACSMPDFKEWGLVPPPVFIYDVISCDIG